ncbi:MAG: hypothetical protein AAB289_15945 [Chloroflexota bacterium]
MFEQFAGYEWDKCRSRYDKSREEVDALTPELTKRDLIFQVLWENGGRCDCTIGRNIVDQPDVWSSVRPQIEKILVDPAPEAVEPLLKRQGWEPAIQPMGRARRAGERYEYEGQNRTV